jgi:hypothetical protein
MAHKAKSLSSVSWLSRNMGALTSHNLIGLDRDNFSLSLSLSYFALPFKHSDKKPQVFKSGEIRGHDYCRLPCILWGLKFASTS